MGANVWIGTRGHEQWIKAPAPRTAFQPVGWSSTTQGRNGRVTGRRSRGTHMEYDLNWPTVPADTARKITDMYYGLQGDGLIHWLDPMVTNALPAHWSFPGLGVSDGPILAGRLRPVAVATAANTKGLPSVSARYSLASGASAPSEGCYIPIPPGYAAHIGIHSAGAASSASVVFAQPRAGEVITGEASVLPAIAATSSTRFNTVIAHSGSMTGITLHVQPGATVASTTLPGSGDIAGMMVEILPVGQSPVGQGFVMGEGNSGCRMFEAPTLVALHAAKSRTPRKSVAVALTEVGP